MFLPIKYQRHTLAREKYYFSNTFYSSLFSISMSIITDLDLALNFFTNSSSFSELLFLLKTSFDFFSQPKFVLLSSEIFLLLDNHYYQRSYLQTCLPFYSIPFVSIWLNTFLMMQ